MVRKKLAKPQQLGYLEQQLSSWDISTVNAPIVSSDELHDLARKSQQPTSSDHLTSHAQQSTSSEEQQILTFAAATSKSPILTVDSDESTSDIQELPVIQPILRRKNCKNGTSNTIKKSVVFDLVGDSSESSDTDYYPASTDWQHYDAIFPDDDEEALDLPDVIETDSDEGSSIEVLSETISSSSFEVENDIVLDYDGYEVERKAKERKKRGEIQYYGEFEKVLDESILTLKISKGDVNNSYCLFSEVKFLLFDEFNSDLWKHCDNCWLYICPDIDSSALYFEWIEPKPKSKKKRSTEKKKQKPDSFKHYRVNGFVNDALWRGFSNAKHFHLQYKDFNCNTREVTVSVFLLSSALKDLNHPSEVKTTVKGLSDTVNLLHNIELPEYKGPKKLKHDYEILFNFIKEVHAGVVYYEESVQHPALLPVLRPYQKSAVEWMLFKENLFSKIEEDTELKLHCLFIELTALDGTILYYNKYGGYFTKNKPLEVLPTPGGILADEMGLGKTVEVLACILNNPSGPIRKPEYLEPIILEENSSVLSKRKKKPTMEDIFTIEVSEEEESVNKEDSAEDSLDSYSNKYRQTQNRERIDSGSDEDYDINEDLQEVRSCRRRATRNTKYKVSSSESDGEDEMRKCTKRCRSPPATSADPQETRATRRGRKRVFSYSEMDDFCVDTPPSSDDEYKVSKCKRTRQSVKNKGEDVSFETMDLEEVVSKKKRNQYNVDDEIKNDAGWTTIESVIVDRCWQGNKVKYKKEGSCKEFKKFLRKRRQDPYYMMTTQERLRVMYNQATTSYSCADAASQQHHKQLRQSFFKTKVSYYLIVYMH